MNENLKAAMDRLSSSQRDAANWEEGAALVLAGPGVGKTTVLTTRIARILEESSEKNFRILALTFTTKAGDEMRSRVEALVPELVDRTLIGTFHSFCAQVLRQHGSHIGIQPTFGIYDQDADRKELLSEALLTASKTDETISQSDVRWLSLIDRLRTNLVSTDRAAKYFRDEKAGAHIAKVYEIYQNALREANVTDFNGMILDVCQLAHKMPAVAHRIRSTYRFWMIDEFQDTTPAQYRMVKFLAGNDFKNLFVVADDDQIIFQWAGASYKQLVEFRKHFEPTFMQLVENRRCPAEVVQAANNLIAHNSARTPGKAPLVAIRDKQESCIELRVFENDSDEASGIAQEVASWDVERRSSTAIIGRNRALLAPVLDALRASGVPAHIVTRRDRFASPQFTWLHSALELCLRPTDRQMFSALVAAANKLADIELDGDLIAAASEGSGKGFLESWATAADKEESEIAGTLTDFAKRLVQSRSSWAKVTTEALDWLPMTSNTPDDIVSDVQDDKAAWEQAARAIRKEVGGTPDLDEFLQGMALRPKEPPPDPQAVRLVTVHSSKGLEFDSVWLMGAAESVLPSWQSLKADSAPEELEEERRNFFVAITRTKNSLIISRAKSYRGRSREESRFIAEMNGHY